MAHPTFLISILLVSICGATLRSKFLSVSAPAKGTADHTLDSLKDRMWSLMADDPSFPAFASSSTVLLRLTTKCPLLGELAFKKPSQLFNDEGLGAYIRLAGFIHNILPVTSSTSDYPSTLNMAAHLMDLGEKLERIRAVARQQKMNYVAAPEFVVAFKGSRDLALAQLKVFVSQGHVLPSDLNLKSAVMQHCRTPGTDLDMAAVYRTAIELAADMQIELVSLDLAVNDPSVFEAAADIPAGYFESVGKSIGPCHVSRDGLDLLVFKYFSANEAPTQAIYRPSVPVRAIKESKSVIFALQYLMGRKGVLFDDFMEQLEFLIHFACANNPVMGPHSHSSEIIKRVRFTQHLLRKTVGVSAHYNSALARLDSILNDYFPLPAGSFSETLMRAAELTGQLLITFASHYPSLAALGFAAFSQNLERCFANPTPRFHIVIDSGHFDDNSYYSELATNLALMATKQIQSVLKEFGSNGAIAGHYLYLETQAKAAYKIRSSSQLNSFIKLFNLKLSNLERLVFKIIAENETQLAQ